MISRECISYKHTHTRVEEKGSNTKTRHNSTKNT